MIDLPEVSYPKETFRQMEDIDYGFKYARSSLGLWGLNKNFSKGYYRLRTTDFDLIK
jgi:hypothetical protein